MSTDFDDITRWCQSRETPVTDISLFPNTGFIADGIAAGFIYFTDSCVAIIDGYISNPNTTAQERDDALNEITEALINVAIFRRCKMIKCDTKLESIKRRALDFGFKSIGTQESFIRGI